MTNKEIKQVQTREQQIWSILDDKLSKKYIDLITELIELNIQLEAECGQ